MREVEVSRFVRAGPAIVEGEGPPDCPSCGGEMEFERSKGTASCTC